MPTVTKSSPSQVAERLQHPAIFRMGDVPRSLDGVVASGFTALDRELSGGWPTARLIEVLCDRVGVGELSLLLSTMPKVTASSVVLSGVTANATNNVSRRRASSLQSSATAESNTQRSLWIFPHGSYAPYAPALEARGVDLRRFAIAQTSSHQETLWAMEQALLSNAVKSVFAWITSHSKSGSQSATQKEPHDFTLRRISLAARKSESLCFLMRPLSAARRASPCELRIAIAPASRNEIEITILKRRGLLRETSLRIDPRELACLAPHRVPITLSNAALITRNPAVEASNLALLLNTTKGAGFGTPPKIRERSFLGER
jgi:protein ImuA